MSYITKNFIEFSKPFIDGLKETFSLMMDTEIKAHSPKIKDHNRTKGEFSSIIGMNGKVNQNGTSKEFKGLIGLSFEKEVYLKIAGAMLMEEYEDYTEEISDTGAEIVNIIMGNAKKALAPKGYEIAMATPSTIRGKDVEIRYPKSTTIIETEIDSDLGAFFLEICYQENSI